MEAVTVGPDGKEVNVTVADLGKEGYEKIGEEVMRAAEGAAATSAGSSRNPVTK